MEASVRYRTVELCTECNGESPVSVTCSIFDIWEGPEWVSDHVVHGTCIYYIVSHLW